jgi:hypothetical protein
MTAEKRVKKCREIKLHGMRYSPGATSFPKGATFLQPGATFFQKSATKFSSGATS